MFEEIAKRLKPGDTVPGAEAFRLYDTYGLPPDFTEELAKDRGLSVDTAGFERELAAQQERARQSSKLGAVKGDPVYVKLAEEGARSEFLGYQGLAVEDARVLAVLRDGKLASRLDAGQEGLIVLDRTPFYAMAGGQVGDHGVIASDGSAAEVHRHHEPAPGPPRPPRAREPRRLRARHDRARRGGRRAPRGGHAPPHGHPPAARGAARDAGARTSSRRAAAWIPTGCASTSATTPRSARASCGTSRTA